MCFFFCLAFVQKRLYNSSEIARPEDISRSNLHRPAKQFASHESEATIRRTNHENSTFTSDSSLRPEMPRLATEAPLRET
jgi:hypothetical protein